MISINRRDHVNIKSFVTMYRRSKMMVTKLFVVVAVAIIIPCRCLPDDIDDFNRITSGYTQQPQYSQGGGIGVKYKDERRIREFEMQATPQNTSPYLSQFVHQGNNLFFKPQVLLGSTLNINPYPSREPEIENEKDEVSSESPIPSTTEKIVKEEQNESSSAEVEISSKKLQAIPEAPILPPLKMPVFPKVVIEEPEVVIENADEKVIIDEERIVIPEPPALISLNTPKLPAEMFIPERVPACMPIYRNDGYEVAVPCLPNIAEPLYSNVINLQSLVENKFIIRPLLTRVPGSVSLDRSIKTIMPFAEDLIGTRLLPSVTVAKYPLKNRRFLVNAHRNLSKMLFERIPIDPEKLRILEDSTSSAYCAHNVVLERVLPNIADQRRIAEALPRPVLEFQ